MKVILTEAQIITLKRKAQELDEVIFFNTTKDGVRRYRNENARYEFIANAIIEYMDKNGITTIPTYRTLTDDNTYKIDISEFEPWLKNPKPLGWQAILYNYLKPKEFDTKIKPLIGEMRPEFEDFSSFSKIGAKNHIVDGLRMASLGEVIVYNTFKMNGIILEHEPQHQIFTYRYVDSNGVTSSLKRKIPDFYWKEKNMMIEVAGFKDSDTVDVNYTRKMVAAKEEMDKQNRKYIILDYHKDRNNKPNFFKLVCETFNFNYNPDDYYKSITYKGIDRAYCEKEVERILRMPVKDTTGAERARVSRMMKDCLSRTVYNDDGTEEVSYDSKWDVRRDMGLLKSTNPETIKKVQVAWCKSQYDGPKKIAPFYSEMYNEKMSHGTVEKILGNNKDMFDRLKKKEICSKIDVGASGEEELDERGRTLANTRKKRLFPKSAMMANPLRFKKYDKEVKDLDEIQTRGKKLLGKGGEREVYLSHINPDMVFKLWGYDDLVKEKEFFDKYPNLYVKIYKVKTYENPHYSNTGVAIMDRVDTKGFKQEVRKLYDALENVGYDISLFSLIDVSRREMKYDEIVDKLNEYDPSMADFFINFRDCVVGVEDSLGRFNYFDRSFDQFGLDKEGNVKCFDV
jgi:hypothetical protein